MLYMDMWMITYILKEEKINLPFIILKRPIKILCKVVSSLVYLNMFTKVFERERVKLNEETKKFTMRNLYDIYGEKNLGIMHLVKMMKDRNFKIPLKGKILRKLRPVHLNL